jgi:hypothetical protein
MMEPYGFWTSTGRILRRTLVDPRRPCSGGDAMVLVTMIGLLALCALLGILFGSEDPRQTGVDPRSEVKFWMRYGIR